MIYDSLDNYSQYCNLENLKKGFEFLKNNDLKNLKDGRYEIEGDKIFANVQSLKTKPKEEKKWEVHRKYIDIQYVIKGFECMGYGILKDFREVVEDYDSDKDVEFLNGSKFNYINVEEGYFTVFYPNDVHAPMLAYQEPEVIKKVIVKIAISW